MKTPISHKQKKYIFRGAGIMFVIGALGTLLGPSPLNILFAPILSISYLTLTVIAAPIAPLREMLAGGIYGSSAGFLPIFITLVTWNTLLGALTGWLIAKHSEKKNQSN